MTEIPHQELRAKRERERERERVSDVKEKGLRVVSRGRYVFVG